MKTLILFFIFHSLPSFANDKPLTLDIVLKSTREYFPDVLNALDKIEKSQAKVQAARGSFDLNFNSELNNRVEGYYDGDDFDMVLEKPLQFLNSKIYMGHRRSENTFPIYEGKTDTLDQGESRIGFQLSLWRNRDIDPKRLKLRNSKLKLDQSRQSFIAKENEVLKKASKAYWNWHAKGHIYRINVDLLAIMEKLQAAVRAKIKQGELARIYETENLQYIMKRRSDVLKTKQEFQEAALLLSLFLRDNKGLPLIVTEKVLPEKTEMESDFKLKTFQSDLKRVVRMSPKLINLDLKTKEAENDILNAENALAPRFDLKVEVSKDQGNGSETLQQEEQKVMLQLDIPIERNLGNGLVNQNKVKRKILKRQRQFEEDNLSVKLKKIYTRFGTFKQVIENTQKEVEFAKTLQVAERRKFAQGTSDFFLVNLRDQNLANAQEKLVHSWFKLSKTIAEYRALTMTFTSDTN